MKNKYLKTVLPVAGVIIGVLIAFVLKPPQALASSAAASGATGRHAMIVMGTIICGLFWWISAVVPDWIVGLAMICVWVITGCCDFKTAFSQFSGSTLWLLIGAFSIAGAVVKTGALRRISLQLMRIFKPTYAGQVLSLLTVGTVISPLLPSATAKSVLCVNMAVSSGTAMNYQAKGREAAGLFSAAWTGAYIMSACFLSASTFSYVIIDVIKTDISWGRWFIAMIPWGVIVLIGMWFSIMRIYRPESEVTLTKDNVRQQLKDMGKMSRAERISVVILFACLICWILESVIGVSPAVVAVVGALLCFGTGIINPKELGSIVPWGLIIFIGSVMQMGTMFSAVGISGWVSTLLTPLFESVGNIYLLVAVIAVLVYIIRLVLNSQVAVIMLFVAILGPIVARFGMGAHALGLVIFTATQMWFMPYQSSTYAAALGAGGEYVRHKDIAKSCAAYCVISLAACLVSLPYWKLIGLIG